MSEMALTADHLIIIGRGRLLADTSTAEFVESSARTDVLVTLPAGRRPGQVADRPRCHRRGQDDGGLAVTGMDAPAIARPRRRPRASECTSLPRGIPRSSEAYLDLTAESTDYQAHLPPQAGDGTRR